MQQISLFVLRSWEDEADKKRGSEGACANESDKESQGSTGESILEFDSNPSISDEWDKENQKSTRSDNSGICAKFRDQLQDYEIHIKNAAAQNGPSRRVYTKTEVYKLFTSHNIERLLGCKCVKCRCNGLLEVPSAKNIAIISAEYRLILAILLSMNHLYLIQCFIERGYTDERVLSQPLEKEELEELANDASEKIGVTHWHDRHFARDFHHERQYEFLLPNLTASDDSIMSFPILVTLPFDLEDRIGCGAYGDVFKAKLLDGYHDFETHVSVLSYTES
jgi:hypothetical protein